DTAGIADPGFRIQRWQKRWHTSGHRPGFSPYRPPATPLPPATRHLPPATNDQGARTPMTAPLAGDGPLFMDPSPGRAREHFRKKRRGLVAKVTTVAEAVRQYVHDGDYLAVGGFGADRIPTAVLHEIVRQRKQELSFAGHTSTHDFQILAAGNLTGRGRLLA